MKRMLSPVITAALLLCGLMAAQNTTTPPQNMPAQSPTTQAPAATQPGAPQAENSNQPHIAAGSVIPVQLTKTVDAKKAK